MDKKRTFMWCGFLAGATALAIIPELFWEDEPQVQQVGGAAHELPDIASVQSVLQASVGSQQPAGLSEERQAIPHADLFAAHSWYIAPSAPILPPLPTTPRATAPAVPVAPPVPFQFVGTVNDEERLHIVLMRGQTIHIVGVGDVIDGTYRVEGLRGREVLLIYLPLDLSQSVLVGSAAGSTL